MDSVRTAPAQPDDLAVFDQGGETWVIARSGGVSCFDVPSAALSGPEWRLPQTTTYPDDLYLRDDPNEPGHWTWEPNVDMKLDDYKALLRSVGLQFLRK